MKKLITFCLLLNYLSFNAQYNLKKFNWEDAGVKGNAVSYSVSVNILNYGGDNTNTTSNNTAFTNAVNALNNQGGIIYFPAGVYKFNSPININRDSIIIKGAGFDSTQLLFNLNGAGSNCISVNGSASNADTTSFLSPATRDSSRIKVRQTSNFTPGDWVYLQCNDSSFMASTWAYGSLGQIIQIKQISNDTIEFFSPFRFNYDLNLKPKIKKINPRIAIAIECLSIKRMDATSNQTSNISFNYAVQSWINGIKSDSTNYAHIELNRSSNIEITNSYFHHAFAYGGGGQAYGIALQFSSNECKIENNIFRNLRHSVLLQAGANGNTISYNYSFDPFWTQFPFPSSSAGDLVLHGNYPFANLFEGNINQNTVIDNSHQKNGPFNTFFRNRSELFGIFMNSNPATDSTQFLGNEVTNTTPGLGMYTLVGNGNLEFGNNIKGVITPTGTSLLTDTSLIYSNYERPNCFDPFVYNWPILGTPLPYNTNSIPAKDRALQGKWAICNCPNFNIGIAKINSDEFIISIYPNPSASELKIVSKEDLEEIKIINVEGKVINEKKLKNKISLDISGLELGVYILEIKTCSNKITRKKFIKAEE